MSTTLLTCIATLDIINLLENFATEDSEVRPFPSKYTAALMHAIQQSFSGSQA